MKKSLVIIFLWALTLLGAFFLGISLQKDQNEPQPEPVQTTGSGSLNQEDPSIPIDPNRIPGPIERSLEDLLVLENRGERIYQFEYMVAQLDAESLPAFLEQIQALPQCHNKDSWVNRLMEKWGELNPQAAAAYIEAFPGASRMGMIGHMAKGWAKSDPRNAWEYVKIQSKDGRDFFSGAPDVLMEVVKTNPALGVEFLNEIAGTQNSGLMSMILGLATRENGNYGEMLDALSGITETTDRRMAMKNLWQFWAELEPENAYAAYQSLEEGPEKQEALAFCLENVPEGEQGVAIKEIVKQWAQNGDLEAATAFVETLPVNKTSDEAVNAIVNQMAQEDAESAMAWVQSMQNEERVRQGQNQVVAYWGSQDFEKAQAFVVALPPGEVKNENLQTLFYSQMGIGKINDTAYSVIPLIEDQDMRDRCVVGLARRAVFEPPARYGVTNTIDKEQVAREVINIPGITEEKRQEALAILGVVKPGG